MDAATRELIRTAGLLTVLLDGFFEGFRLQHNSYLLNIIGFRIGHQARVNKPWSAALVKAVSFTREDLMQLDGRVEALLQQLPRGCEAMTNGRRRPSRLQWNDEAAAWKLSEAPEIRTVRMQAADGFREGNLQINVLSYSITFPLKDLMQQGHVKVLLSSQKASIICLQGLNPDGDGKDLAQNLIGEGFGIAHATNTKGETSAVLWDKTRWNLEGYHRYGSSVSVDLQSVESDFVVRVASMRPKLSDCGHCGLLEEILEKPAAFDQVPPLIVCGDFAHIGGAEAASLVPGLLGLASAMVELTDEELMAPRPSKLSLAAATATPIVVREVWTPCSVLFRGLQVDSVLSQHTEGFLSMMTDEALDQMCPGGRLPIVAGFVPAALRDSSN